MRVADPRAEVDQAIAHTRRCQKAVGKALLDQDPALLVLTAQDFQGAIAQLSERVQRLRQLGPLPDAVRDSLKEIGQAIGLHREACLRRSALVDQSVQSVLPGTGAAPVYGDGNGPYGGRQRRSGAFKVLSA